jgi:hypothetical protein
LGAEQRQEAPRPQQVGDVLDQDRGEETAMGTGSPHSQLS